MQLFSNNKPLRGGCSRLFRNSVTSKRIFGGAGAYEAVTPSVTYLPGLDILSNFPIDRTGIVVRLQI